jgi:DNA-binding MarR family transcriptional regulator
MATRGDITFYEINQESRNAPTGEEIDIDIFEYLNHKGAASTRAIIKHSRDWSQMQVSQSLGRLINNGYITRRIIALDEGE